MIMFVKKWFSLGDLSHNNKKLKELSRYLMARKAATDNVPILASCVFMKEVRKEQGCIFLFYSFTVTSIYTM